MQFTLNIDVSNYVTCKNPCYIHDNFRKKEVFIRSDFRFLTTN